MAQLSRYDVAVTHGSPDVACNPLLAFPAGTVLAGSGFTILNDPIVYTIAGSSTTTPASGNTIKALLTGGVGMDPAGMLLAGLQLPGTGLPITTLHLTVPYQGTTDPAARYQITQDYTPNLQLAEINAGDQDWATHLTQEVIRKLDTIVGLQAAATKVGTVYASAIASPPSQGTWALTGTQTIGATTVTYYKRTA